MNTRHSSRWPLALCATTAVLMAAAALAQVPGTASKGTVAAVDIRDIRGLKPTGTDWLVPILLSTAVAGLGAGAALWAWRRRQQRLDLTPNEIALSRLEAALALLREGNSREFSIEVSGIVRQYVEDAYHIIATHQTTDEFLHHFAQASDPILSGRQELMANFLQSCDLAKFGGWNLTLDGMQDTFDSARRFIVDSAQPSDVSTPVRAPQHIANRETYDSLPST